MADVVSLLMTDKDKYSLDVDKDSVDVSSDAILPPATTNLLPHHQLGTPYTIKILVLSLFTSITTFHSKKNRILLYHLSSTAHYFGQTNLTFLK
jgi:hypothetical protein